MKKNRYGQLLIWSVLEKTALNMKIWLLLLIPIGVAFAENAYSQTLSIELKDVTIRQALQVIERESGYSFFYNDSFDDLKKITSISAKNESLQSVIARLLSPTSLTHKFLEGKLIVIVLKDSQQDIRIKGRVVAADTKESLPGVNVTIKGSTRGVITNANGEYTIDAASGEILVFSFVGYTSSEIKVTTETIINVELQVDVQTLTEVSLVSTGYQEMDKRLFTGSAVMLDSKEFKAEGTVDLSRMLQGKAAGVSVQNVSGTFGAAPKIRIRGATSITGDNKPLWVIDNVVLEDVVNVSAEQLTTGDPNTLIGSSVAGLNADDIESITVLKDASATALYGARAKDGVIVIKTKRGRVGKAQVTYSGNFSSYLKPTYDNFNILNSVDQMSVYAEMERKGLLNHAAMSMLPDGGVYKKMYDIINDSYNEQLDQFELLNTPEQRKAYLQRYALANTDWFDILFKNSFVQEHSLGVSSGTDASQLYFSASYYDDSGWTIADQVDRYTLNARGTFKISDKIGFGLSANGSSRIQRVPGTVAREVNVVEGRYNRDFDINPFSYALNTSRVLTPYDKNGNLEYFTRNYSPFNILKEVASNYIDLNLLDLRLQGDFTYNITKHFKYEFVGAVRDVRTTTEHKVEEQSNMAEAYRADGTQVIRQGNKFLYYNPDYPNLDPVVVLPEGGFYNRSDDQMRSYYLKNQIDWNYSFNSKHNLSVVAGQELRLINRQNSYSNGYGYQFNKGGLAFTDYLMIKQLLEGNFNYFGMGYSRERYASFYAGANYAWNDKYILNATLRQDGSNRLGESRTARWLPTWNVSAAWNIDTETFMQSIRAVDFLTVKAGYGLTANVGNATNSSVVYRSSTTSRPHLDEKEAQIIIEGLENQDLTWEKQYELNLGLSAGLLKTFTITFDYYKRNHFDLISVIKTSGIGGEPYKAINYADMKSHGVDLSLGATILNQGKLNWTTNFVFTYNKSKITNLKNMPRIYNLVFQDGGAQQGYPVRGLFSIDFQGLNPETGVPNFIDHNGHLSNNVFLQSLNTQYLKYEGPVDPTVTGGFSNTLQYRNFSLNVFLTYQAGNKIRLNPAFKSAYSDLDAMPREFLDRWVLPGDERASDIPSIPDLTTLAALSATYPYNSYNYSTERVADGSFIRLRTVSLSYNVPEKILPANAFTNASVSLTGTNLWLLYADKKLYGQDPEFFSSGGVALPVAKQITLSVKLSF
ncbi:SusC/RagA family TonB-linked outer membrane protein [Chryseosolibacter indicus]|uniref:SusC/RagA family TonB-linked outer membrane protein n=1 Tax=Chryseosolibacter indicus TaxID=2782351 RepID=A0ABS5VQR3_9BACT|nr:SusC/RagA family TonB-linked outer membrane protein [Chryseosolibacter indicus]MBT1703794.1 SusC/RagA family TonB-linked outer membrane protein [Chryseosolibacter indicus]